MPLTWDDYFAVARAVVRESGAKVRGFGQRGRGEWHTMYTGFATHLWSCGPGDFDPDGRAAFADPDAVAITAAFISALRESGPVDWTQQRWYELALDFGRGDYALLVDSDHDVAFFEDERHSELVGRIGYALPPAGPGGERRPNLWTWSLAMSAASRDKHAARDFIGWAASKPFLLRSAGEGNMNPTRTSAWNDPGFLALTAPWGDFATVSRQLLDEYATVLITPTPNYREIALRSDRGAARELQRPRRPRSAPSRRRRTPTAVRGQRLTVISDSGDVRCGRPFRVAGPGWAAVGRAVSGERARWSADAPAAWSRSPAGRRCGALPPPAADVFLVRDDRVVTTPVAQDAIGIRWDLAAGETRTMPALASLVSCEPDWRAASRRVVYELYARVVVTPDNGAAQRAFGGRGGCACGDRDGPAHRVSAQGSSPMCGPRVGQPVTMLTPYCEATVVYGWAQPVVPFVAITLPRIQAPPEPSRA